MRKRMDADGGGAVMPFGAISGMFRKIFALHPKPVNP